MDNFGKIKLKYVAYSYASAQKQSEVFECGKYEVYGASGLVGYLNTYGADTEYIGIVKDGAGVGRAHIYKPYTSLLGTMAYIVPIDIKATNINFLKYSIDALDLGNTAGDRATIPHIYFSKYGNEYISSYPIMQQEKIANYLDEKCGKIDELIANQQGQIEKLKEYKQSVITEAVTKGLDKSAPLKDSGIEWIGEIPENYIICKIKHILDNSDFGIKCGPFGSALTGKVVDNGSVLIYGQWNVVDGNFNKKRNTITGKDFDDLSAYEVLPGDILVSMMGTIGKCAIVPTDISRGIMDSHIIKIRLNNNVVLHKFFEYQYDKDNSFIVYEYFKRVKKGFIMDGLNTTLIKNAFFILPSLYEQQQIVDYLDEKCGKIDRLIAIKQEKIEKLQEYKKSLIYEYVTGKKEVV